MTQLDAALAEADVVVSCTGAVGHLVGAQQVSDARAGAGRTDRQVFLDLAMPHDIDPQVGAISGVRLIDLEELGNRLAEQSGGRAVPEVQEVTDLVTAEVAEYVTRRLAKRVTPTVAALRARAAEVVDAELSRLDQKAAAAGRGGPGRGAPRGAPDRRQAAAHPDGPDQAAVGRRADRRLRGRPSRAVRPGPRRRGGRLGPAGADRRRPDSLGRPVGRAAMSVLRLGTRAQRPGQVPGRLGGRPAAGRWPPGHARRDPDRG